MRSSEGLPCATQLVDICLLTFKESQGGSIRPNLMPQSAERFLSSSRSSSRAGLLAASI